MGFSFHKYSKAISQCQSVVRKLFRISFQNVSQELLVIFDIEEDAISRAYEFTTTPALLIGFAKNSNPLASAGRKKKLKLANTFCRLYLFEIEAIYHLYLY